MANNWIISEENQLTLSDIDRQGNKMLVGNGYLGCRGTLGEFTKEQKTATIVSGVYDQFGEQWREPVNLPNGGFTQVFHNGVCLHALECKVLEHHHSLDMFQALFERNTIIEIVDSTKVRIHSMRFASLARSSLICESFTVSADRECFIEIQTGIDGDVWDINGPHLEELKFLKQDGVITATAVTHEKKIPVAVSEFTVYKHPGQVSRKNFIHCSEDNKILRIIGPIQLGEPYTFYKFISHNTGVDSSDPLEASRLICKQAGDLGFEFLFGEHTALWAQRWQDCEIQIEGDSEAQQALRFSLYHLLSIAPTHADNVSIPARGLSGQVYKGAIFWDTEIFMLPFFSHTFPDVARNLLRYRFHTLDGARRKAQEYGYRGAFYAWESQDSGDDACTLFNITDVFTNRPMRTFFRDKQVHISADIVYAFWQYYTLTGDETIWHEGGAEVVFECARFYLSYAYYNPDKGRYEILDVTGPDEYHERVHNNAFTNRMVAHTFTIFLRVVDLLTQKTPRFFLSLIEKLHFSPDLNLIAQLSQRLYLPDAIADGEVIPQFDGYFSLEDVSLHDLLARKLHPNEYLGGGNGLATTTQILKQADVVLGLFLFDDLYSQETKTANWEFYESRTEHGSSLSACSYSIVAAKIGKVDWAYRYFMRTATIDLVGDGKQYVGTLYIGGTHPAGNGGAWMAMVYGLCGIRCEGNSIIIDPHLPDHWTRVGIPLTIQGQKILITLTHEKIAVEPLAPLTSDLYVIVSGMKRPLEKSGELTLVPVS